MVFFVCAFSSNAQMLFGPEFNVMLVDLFCLRGLMMCFVFFKVNN